MMSLKIPVNYRVILGNLCNFNTNKKGLKEKKKGQQNLKVPVTHSQNLLEILIFQLSPRSTWMHENILTKASKTLNLQKLWIFLKAHKNVTWIFLHLWLDISGTVSF